MMVKEDGEMANAAQNLLDSVVLELQDTLHRDPTLTEIQTGVDRAYQIACGEIERQVKEQVVDSDIAAFMLCLRLRKSSKLKP